MKQIDKLTLALALAVLVLAGLRRPARRPTGLRAAGGDGDRHSSGGGKRCPAAGKRQGPAAPEIPLDGASLTAPVPDFLDGEQQLLYRQAYSLYTHLLGCETGGVEYSELYLQQGPSETVEAQRQDLPGGPGPLRRLEGLSTPPSTRCLPTPSGRPRAWRDLCAHGEQLCFLDASRGGGYYRDDSRPDTFTLVEQTEDEISFTLTGYYSPMGEGGEDYTIDFPIRLVRTEAGWRFDEFHRPPWTSWAPRSWRGSPHSRPAPDRPGTQKGARGSCLWLLF